MRRWEMVNQWGFYILGFTVVTLLLLPAVSLAAEDDFTHLPNVPDSSATSDSPTNTEGSTGAGDPAESESNPQQGGQQDTEVSPGAGGTAAPAELDQELAVTGAYESTLYAMVLVGTGGLLLSFGPGSAHQRIELEV